MRNWEKDLPPITRERLAKIGELTREEKERMKDSERAVSLLAELYQGRIDPEGLWRKLKEEGKPSLLREAQMGLIDSLSFASTPADLQKRRDGVLAIETLKEEQNTPMVELHFKLMADLQKRYRAEIEQGYSAMKAEVERNPRMRAKQVQQGQNTMVIQLTVDEAIRQIPQWRDFLSNQEKTYHREFAKVTEELRRELK